jgi:hypothetical protein
MALAAPICQCTTHRRAKKMLVIYFPTTFKVGDTVDRNNINGELARVTYEDKDTLVIEPGEADPRENDKVVEVCRNSAGFTEGVLRLLMSSVFGSYSNNGISISGG